MAFKKTYRSARRAGGTRTIAVKALKAVKTLNHKIQAEINVMDTTISQNPSWTGTASNLNQIPQGLDIAGRIGNAIKLKGLRIRGTVDMTSGINTHLRMLVVCDKSNTGTPPAINDLFVATQLGSLQAPNAMFNPDTMARYSILWDNTRSFSNSSPKCFNFEKYISLKGKSLYFTGATAGSIYRNSLYLLFISNEVTATPQVNCITRLQYYDN